MKISALFETAEKGAKYPPLVQDQHEFTIDRENRRFPSLLDVLAKRETLRVQTNRPFVWTGSVSLPDKSLGELRPITCNVTVEGALPPSREATQMLVSKLLDNNFDYDRFFGAALAHAIAELGAASNGALLNNLRATPDDVQARIAVAMLRAGAPITRVTLKPVAYDARPTPLDLVDDAEGLTFRAKDSLEEHRVNYKARLVWGKETAQVLGRFAYHGSIDGKSQGPRLDHPLVPNQVQPLETYFRQLLAAALGQEEIASITVGDNAVLERVKAAVSKNLGLGTGRVLDTIVLYTRFDNLTAKTERVGRVTYKYEILGLLSRYIEIEHVFRFGMIDRDRWVSAGSPEPENFLGQEILGATKVYLHNKNFEDVVKLYSDQEKENEFKAFVTELVQKSSAMIGYRLDSISEILSIPEHNFLDGHEIVLPEQRYQLSDPHLEPAMRVKAMLKVDDAQKFARALARGQDFEVRVEATIQQTIRSTLRRSNALDYYGSPFVNGISIAAKSPSELAVDAADVFESSDQDPFADALKKDLSAKLKDDFGLKLESIGLEPATDPIIDRMKSLASASIPFDQAFDFRRGNNTIEIQMSAMGNIYIEGLYPNNWKSFYYNVPRYDTADSHKAAIHALAVQVLRLAETTIVSRSGESAQDNPELLNIIRQFTVRLRQEFGLDGVLYPLKLSIFRPHVDRTAVMALDYLHQEMEAILARRKTLAEAGNYDDVERERLTAQLKHIREEIRVESEQRDLNIATRETVDVIQDQSTGALKLLADKAK